MNRRDLRDDAVPKRGWTLMPQCVGWRPPSPPPDSPAVLHVGGFVHADGQFDPQVRVLAVLGDDHPVELSQLRPVGGRIQEHLKRGCRGGVGDSEFGFTHMLKQFKKTQKLIILII